MRMWIVAGVAAVLLCGMGCTAKTGPAKKQIGFLMTLDDPYWQNMRLGAMDEGQKLGVDVVVTNGKEDPVLQLQQIQEMIAKQVDAVCLVPLKKEPLVTGLQALNSAGIPVVLVNREVAEGGEYICYTGTDTYEGAATSAKILMQAIGGAGAIAELHQHLGTGPELARTQALRDVLKEFPQVNIVARVPHEGDRGKAVKEVQALLGKFPDLKGIYVHGDPQAIAAAEACRDAGRPEVAVVGMGGSVEAIQAIRDGNLTGTSYQQPEEEGRQAVRLAVKHLNGEKLEKQYLIPCPAITHENAADFKGQF